MKNIKYVLGLLLLIAVIIPQITFASWWNPFTWFQKSTPAVQQEPSQAIPLSTSTSTVPVSISVPVNKPNPVAVKNVKKIISNNDSTKNNWVDNWKDIQLGSATSSQDGVSFSFSNINFGQTQTLNPYNYDASSVIDNLIGYDNKTTVGAWWEVDLTLNNNQTNRIDLETRNFKMIDQAGRIYYPESALFCGRKFSADSTLLENYNTLGLVLSLEPDIPCVSHLLFEVSKDSTSNYLDFQYLKFPASN